MKKKVLIIIIILTIAFIVGNSILSKEQSANASSLVKKFMTPFLELFVGKGNVSNFLIRKMAHFFEFFVLGLEFTALFKIKYRRYSLTAFIAAFFIGFMDESIQIFTGRGSSVADVWIDAAGAFCGILFITLIIYLISKLNRKNIRSQHT